MMASQLAFVPLIDTMLEPKYEAEALSATV